MFGALILAGALSSSTSAFAASRKSTDHNGVLTQCQYLPLATNFAMPQRFGAKNSSVCVDIPVEVKKAKIVFNMVQVQTDLAFEIAIFHVRKPLNLF